MASTIGNLSKMTQDLSMDPVYDTNWCDIPAEIKLVCIGKMGLRERFSLRCTSKAEKLLVDSQKMKFQSGSFSIDGFQLNCFWPFWDKRCILKQFKKPNESVELPNLIFKFAEFERISLYYPNKQVLNFTEDISAKCVFFESCESETVIDGLQKIKKGVEAICINARIPKYYGMKAGVDHYDLDEILAISHMWINKNSKIGSTFQLSSLVYFHLESDLDFLSPFLDNFTDRIVSETEKRVRIRTNNPDRHILLERGLDHYYTIYDEFQFFRLMVISAEMKESEYDDNCKAWILSIDCEAYDCET